MQLSYIICKSIGTNYLKNYMCKWIANSLIIICSLSLSEFLVHTELDPDATDGEFTTEEGLVSWYVSAQI